MVYAIYERITNKIIGTYKNRTRANNKRDKLDNAYGSYHYGVKVVA